MRPPDDYMDLILIPSILHIDPMAFAAYPPKLQDRMRNLLINHIASGWTGKPELIKKHGK